MNPIFPELPTQLGIYSLTKLIGVREISELYLAKQSYVDRAVVIEVLRPECQEGEKVDFLDSARLNAAVSLPQVAPVLESASTGTLHYVIQEEPEGKPLKQQTTKLTVDQAFTLVQSVAEVYCACLEQEVAARPITLEDIYIDGKEFRFFSPVVAGGWTDELRAAQMEGLADILTKVLSPRDAEKSNLSIIIHWLRNGYGGEPMQWQPLAASLKAVRASRQRTQRGVPLMQRVRALYGNKVAQKQALRSLLNLALLGLVMLGVAVGVGCLGLLFEERVVDTRPAFSDGCLHCMVDKRPIRVEDQPVSVEEYSTFLNAWKTMSSREKTILCQGLPANVVSDSHQPRQWDEQVKAAAEKSEWNGFKMSPHAPVRGVSFYDALVCARYYKAELPSLDVIRTVRQQCYGGEPMMEEWSRDRIPETVPYEEQCIVCPASGNDVIEETDLGLRSVARGFRLVNKK